MESLGQKMRRVRQLRRGPSISLESLNLVNEKEKAYACQSLSCDTWKRDKLCLE
jgi:hypothetical protein